jgi:hydrogenase expression/formation protein HypC
MCLSVPARVVEVHDPHWATVDVGGTTRRVSIDLIDDVRVDEYVLLHVGFALEKINREEAEATLAFFDDMANTEGAYSGPYGAMSSP